MKSNQKGKLTGVIEFTSLSNSQTATANDKNLLDINILLGLDDPAIKVRPGIGG
jgi:hypothetical protein